MRSPDHPIDRDLDVADLRRQPPMGSVKRGHVSPRGKRGMRRYLLGFMVALVLVLFSAVVWFAYQDLMPGGDSVPPLIRADAGELKRQPDERGGLPLVNEESAVVQALDEPESPVRVERIVPRESTAPRSTADVIPEVLEAEPAPAAATDPALAAADAAGDVEQLVADADPATGGEATGGEAVSGDAAGTDQLDTLLAEIIEGPVDFTAIEPAAGPAGEAAPVLAERVPMPADGMAQPGEVAAEVTPSAVAASSVTDDVAALEAADTGNAGTTTLPALPSAVTGQAASAPATSAPAAAPRTAAAPTAPLPPAESTATAATAGATPPPAAPPATSAETAETVVAALPSPALAESFNGAFRVQLLAVRDAESAAGAWTGLQQRFPSALGPLRSQVQRADIGGSTFYRLHAGPFADRSGALAVCDALQTQGADCFVVAPTT